MCLQGRSTYITTNITTLKQVRANKTRTSLCLSMVFTKESNCVCYMDQIFGVNEPTLKTLACGSTNKQLWSLLNFTMRKYKTDTSLTTFLIQTNLQEIVEVWRESPSKQQGKLAAANKKLHAGRQWMFYSEDNYFVPDQTVRLHLLISWITTEKSHAVECDSSGGGCCGDNTLKLMTFWLTFPWRSLKFSVLCLTTLRRQSRGSIHEGRHLVNLWTVCDV